MTTASSSSACPFRLVADRKANSIQPGLTAVGRTLEVWSNRTTRQLGQVDGLKASRSPFESPTTTIAPAIAGELKTAECAS